MRNTAWLDMASCRQLPPADIDRVFFDAGPQWTEAAKVCGSCPSQESCLDSTADSRMPFGFQGGETPADRRRRLDIPRLLSTESWIHDSPAETA